MIQIEHISKTYGDVKSLSDITATIGTGSIYGLIGSNGSGKSTLLKLMCGAMTPDSGRVLYDGETVYEAPSVKQSVVYLSDEQYFIPSSTLDEMASLYASLYHAFSQEKYLRLVNLFGLDRRRKIATFSKGMKKQSSILLGLSACPKFLLCDETFDGIDPVMRQFVKKLLAEEVVSAGMTPVIASHNLREIEDICDHIGLLHRGGILFESDLDSLKREIHAVQIVPEEGTALDLLLSDFHVVSQKTRGSLINLVVRGEKERLEAALQGAHPRFCEIIPLTLEEIFICEMEERGYDYSNVIL